MDNKTYVFSAPGRTELGGNHTDHQHGRVLAAAVNLEAVARVTLNNSSLIKIKSEGFDDTVVDIQNTEVVEAEKNTTSALVRGVAASFISKGADIKGFDAYVTSTVLSGSGLSSSAAFEVLIGTICNNLFFDNKLSAIEIAQIGQYAENVYFGKPCGLMDQMASSVGGIVAIDFKNPVEPIVESITFDFKSSEHALCIIDSGANHADLTDEYSAIPCELNQICGFFGKQFLRDVDEDEFMKNLPELRKNVSDRAILRAMHIYQENLRVESEINALKSNDFDKFLRLVTESGQSSWMLLQNIMPSGAVAHQEVAFALALCQKFLNGKGACRVHGGGFAGTVQAFVPQKMLEDFKYNIESVLGADSCHVLSIRDYGGVRVE